MAKILLVEDDLDETKIYSEILKFEGYEVETALDGEEALNKLKKSSPDLIATDIMLPKIDGWKLCRKIKKNPSTRHIPVLVLTAKSEELNELMSYESGADAFVAKPFKNEDFLEAVKRLLSDKKTIQ